jgi:hypothetical protein
MIIEFTMNAPLGSIPQFMAQSVGITISRVVFDLAVHLSDVNVPDIELNKGCIEYSQVLATEILYQHCCVV